MRPLASELFWSSDGGIIYPALEVNLLVLTVSFGEIFKLGSVATAGKLFQLLVCN